MRFIPFAIAALISVALAALSIAAFAAQQYQDERLTVRLLEQPCPEDWLTAGLAHYGAAKAATVTIAGQSVVGCWVAQGDKILLADIYGRAGYLMADQFKSVD